MNKHWLTILIFFWALFAALMFTMCHVTSPYVTTVLVNTYQDTTGTWYSCYIIDDGRHITDTANKYHTWDHIQK